MTKMGSRGHRSKRWVYCKDLTKDGGLLTLDEAKAHHLRVVLRLPPDSAVVLTNGRGLYAEALLRYKDKKYTTAEITSKVQEEQRLGPGTSLLMGLAKNATMDLVVEKAAECGAGRLIPVVTSRSVVRPAQAERPEVRRPEL